jgi:transposase InsO family protein
VRRLISDNAFAYRHNRSLRELLAAHGIRHSFIPGRRPQANGKVKRYQQTLKREWALGAGLPVERPPRPRTSHWLAYYNERRPHSLARRPAAEQPRSQRPEAGHLGSRLVECGAGVEFAPLRSLLARIRKLLRLGPKA